jgi:hypothetical protein
MTRLCELRTANAGWSACTRISGPPGWLVCALRRVSMPRPSAKVSRNRQGSVLSGHAPGGEAANLPGCGRYLAKGAPSPLACSILAVAGGKVGTGCAECSQFASLGGCARQTGRAHRQAAGSFAGVRTNASVGPGNYWVQLGLVMNISTEHGYE